MRAVGEMGARAPVELSRVATMCLVSAGFKGRCVYRARRLHVSPYSQLESRPQPGYARKPLGAYSRSSSRKFTSLERSRNSAHAGAQH